MINLCIKVISNLRILIFKSKLLEKSIKNKMMILKLILFLKFSSCVTTTNV